MASDVTRASNFGGGWSPPSTRWPQRCCWEIADGFRYVAERPSLRRLVIASTVVIMFGFNYISDNMKQIFAGSKDGRYDFGSLDEFLANQDFRVRIYFGNVTFPNYDETQDVWALFAQDTWKPTPRWTVNYGLRWGKTDNPSGIPHVFPEGENIPDDSAAGGDPNPNCNRLVIRLLEYRHRTDDLQPTSGGALGVILVSLGIAEIDQEAVALMPGDESVVSLNGANDGSAKLRQEVTVVFGFQALAQLDGADEVAEHDG